MGSLLLCSASQCASNPGLSKAEGSSVSGPLSHSDPGAGSEQILPGNGKRYQVGPVCRVFRNGGCIRQKCWRTADLSERRGHVHWQATREKMLRIQGCFYQQVRPGDSDVVYLYNQGCKHVYPHCFAQKGRMLPF